ncbi:MAG: urease accessory protein UreF [Blastocatellia bacterium]|nr:MAG: urease accessory protein UreF [Blastocatellia bacterium]
MNPVGCSVGRKMRCDHIRHDPAAPTVATRLVRVLQFGDSMFPVGGFAFSCGVESAIQTGVVGDAATLHAFTCTAVEQAARGDGIALIAAHRAAVAADLDTLIRVDEEVYARKLSEETRSMSRRLGKKFAEMGARVIGAPLLHEWRNCIEGSRTPGCYPVALAVTFAAEGLPALDAFVVHQSALAATILGAALRLMKVSHVQTQAILFELSGRTEAAYETAAAAQLSDMSAFAPLSEILAAVHGAGHVRLFMS